MRAKDPRLKSEGLADVRDTGNTCADIWEWGYRDDDISDADAELERLVACACHLDLAYNVYVDGQHGNYRCVPLPVPLLDSNWPFKT